MKQSKIITIGKIFVVFCIFIIVVSLISTFNTPRLDTLTGDIATRYLEMPSGKYAGDAILNNITGQGNFYFDTGEIYVGAWENNEMSGKGKFTYTTGAYDGDFSKGKRNGQGTFTWNDGSAYTGAWTSDKLNGNGTLTQAQAVYDGEFVDSSFKEGTITLTTEMGTYKLTAVNGTLTDQIEIAYSNGITYNAEMFVFGMFGNT